MQRTEKPSLTNVLLISLCTPDFKGEEAIESLVGRARLVTTLGISGRFPVATAEFHSLTILLIQSFLPITFMR